MFRRRRASAIVDVVALKFFTVSLASCIAVGLGLAACRAFDVDDAERPSPSPESDASVDGAAPEGSVTPERDGGADGGGGAAAGISFTFDTSCAPFQILGGQGTLSYVSGEGRDGGACRFCLTSPDPQEGFAGQAIATLPVIEPGKQSVRLAYRFDRSFFPFELVVQELGSANKNKDDAKQGDGWKTLNAPTTPSKVPTTLQVAVDAKSSSATIGQLCVLLDDLSITPLP